MTKGINWFLVIALLFISCNKEKHDEIATPQIVQTDYLLSKVRRGIVGVDDTYLDLAYNSKNQLIKLKINYYYNGGLSGVNYYDSLIYDEKNRLQAYRKAYTASNSGNDTLRVKLSYNSNTITRVISPQRSSFFSHKFTLIDSKVVKIEYGYQTNGMLAYDDKATVFCKYNNGNITNEYSALNYQLGAFKFHNNVYNPFLTLGQNVWTLFNYEEFRNAYSTEAYNGLIFGESTNFPSKLVKYINNPQSVDSVVHSSEVIESFEGDPLLPKIIKSDNANYDYHYIRKQ